MNPISPAAEIDCGRAPSSPDARELQQPGAADNGEAAPGTRSGGQSFNDAMREQRERAKRPRLDIAAIEALLDQREAWR